MDEEEALRAEIAKLSGAINTHKQAGPASSSLSSRGFGAYHHSNTAYRGWSPARGRGRGRGAPLPARNRTLILNDSQHKPSVPSSSSSATAAAAPSSASTAVPLADSSSSTSKDANADPSEKGEAAALPSVSTSASATAACGSTAPSESWIKRKTTHNMSLVSSAAFQKTEPARLAAIAASQSAKAEARAKAKQKAAQKAASWTAAAKSRGTSSDASVRRGDNMGEVVIDGVVFEFDPSGTKLVKKAVQPSAQPDSIASGESPTALPSAGTSNLAGTSSTPLRTSINGQAYVRTKRGNLVSAELIAKKRAQKEQQAKLQRLAAMGQKIGELQTARNAGQKRAKGSNRTLDNTRPKGLCAFFNKTGQCKRGLSCPFVHDVSKVSLCPRALRPQGCKLPPGTCPLSHNPTPERVPHCVHYLRSGQCRNGDDCVYTHSDRLADGLATRICSDFSRLGWCDRGRDCPERHTWECPEFAEKGKCDRKGCRLLHVIRAQADGGGAKNGDGEDAASASRGRAGSGSEEPGQLQDGDLFMRDDVAAVEPEQEGNDDEDQGATAASLSSHKRKRPLLNAGEDAGELGEGVSSADEGVHFYIGGGGRRKRRGKEFAGQNDFISFAEEEEGDEEEEEGMGEGDEADEGEEDELDEHGSVHSEDVEMSCSEAEDEEDEAEEQEEGGDGGASDPAGESEDEHHLDPSSEVQYGRHDAEADADADGDGDVDGDDDDKLVDSYL